MIEKLRKRMKILAVGDAVLSPEWEYRYFSYNSKWSDTEELASMRDGCGKCQLVRVTCPGVFVGGARAWSASFPVARVVRRR